MPCPMTNIMIKALTANAAANHCWKFGPNCLSQMAAAPTQNPKKPSQARVVDMTIPNHPAVETDGADSVKEPHRRPQRSQDGHPSRVANFA